LKEKDVSLMEHKPCFNRKDSNEFKYETFTWKGPYSWPEYEKNESEKIPNVSGVYLWTFKYKEGYLIYLAGATTSMKRRFKEHTKEFESGNYYILDVDSAMKGERQEHWYWNGAQKYPEEFDKRKDHIFNCMKKQLQSMHIFVSEIPKEYQYRMEATIMHGLYYSKEKWSELADRGMKLDKVRNNDESPIIARNILENQDVKKIYGLFDE